MPVQRTIPVHRFLLRALGIGIVPLLASASIAVASADDAVSLRLSAGTSWQARNTVQIPNTDLGTRFSLKNAVGEGPVPFARLEIDWSIDERHGLRVLLAPLSYTESATFDDPVRFAGASFDADRPIEATYRFDSWRVGYRYSLVQDERVSVRVGATLKVRDAEIRLKQGTVESFDDDVGLVPLLYLAGRYRLGERWTVGADLDGLAGGPGRAIDAGVTLDFSIGGRWRIGAELRVLDGGADTDEVYNFARFDSAAIVLGAGL